MTHRCYLLCLLLITNGCDDEPVNRLSIEEARANRWVGSFVIQPSTVETLYTNSDVDAVLFRYSTAVPQAMVWERMSEKATREGWSVKSHDRQRRIFRRIRNGGRYPSSEEARVAIAGRWIVVAYIQVDHFHVDGHHRWTEDDWAKTYWPLFENAVGDSELAAN